MAEIDIKCRNCGRYFAAFREDAQYCSGACRQAASKARQTTHSRAVADLLRETSEAIVSAAPRGVLESLASDAAKLLA